MTSSPPSRFRHPAWWALPAVLVAAWFAGTAYVNRHRVGTDNAYLHADSVIVMAAVSGRVRRVDVKEHQQVQAGEVLFEIDPLPFEAARDEARAALNHARQDAGAMQARLKGAEAAGRAAELALQQAQSEQTRQEELGARHLVARQVRDDARWSVQVAQARQQESLALVTALRQELAGGAPGALQEAEARLKQADFALAQTVVRAPGDGVVGKLRVQPGTMTSPTTSAMVLVLQDTVRVEANFKETEIGRLKAGQRASVIVDAYPDESWEAEVASIGPATGSEFSVLPAQNATGNWIRVVQRVPVHLRVLGGPDARLRGGLSAKVVVHLPPPEN